MILGQYICAHKHCTNITITLDWPDIMTDPNDFIYERVFDLSFYQFPCLWVGLEEE